MANQRMQEDNIKYVVSAETDKAQQDIHKLTQETKSLAKEERERRKAMIELEAQGKKNSDEYRNLQKESKGLSDKIKDNNKQINELTKKVDVNGMSMVQLKKRAKELQMQLDNTSEALHPEEWNKTNGEIIKIKTRMDELSQQSRILKGQLQSTSQMAEQQSVTLNKLSGYWEKVKFAVKGFIAAKILSYIKDVASESVKMAESADGVKRAFDRIDDGTVLNKLRKATKGTVSDLSLMQATVKANDFRIPLQDLGKYLQFAQLKAQQTGQSVDYLTDSIVMGLGRKSLLILDNLGLSGAEINEEIAKTGDFMKAVSSIVDRQLVAAGSNYVSAADKAEASTIRLQNSQLELGQALLPLKQNWDEAYTDAKVNTMELVVWMIKHKEIIGLLSSAVLAYIAVEKLQSSSTQKNIALRILEIGYEKAKALYLGITRGAMLLYTAATEALAGRTLNASIAMGMFNKVTKLNPIALLVAGVVAAVGALTLFRSKTDIAAAGLKELNTKIASEKAELTNVFNELRKTNPGTTERIRLVKQLKDAYPDLLANYDLEKASLKEITKAQNAANTALTNRIVTEMKAKTASDFVEKNISTQMDKIEYLLGESQREIGDAAFAKFKTSLTKVLNDSNTQFSSFWKTFGKYFNAQIGSDTMASFQDTFRSLRADQKNMADGLKEINSRYDPFISSVKTSIKLSDEELKQEVEANSIIKKLEKQKQHVQDTWKEDTKENIALKNKEIEKIDKQIKKYTDLGKVTDKSDTKEVALKNLEASNDAEVNEIRLAGREKQQSEFEIESKVLVQEEGYYKKRISMLEKFSESAKKADKRADYAKQVVDAKTKLLDIEEQKEKQSIANLEKLREQALADQETKNQLDLKAYYTLFANKKISQEEYDIYSATLAYKNATEKTAIEKDYSDKSKALTLNTASLKEKIEKDSADRITKAEQTSFDARLKAENTYRENIAAMRKIIEESSTNPADRLKVEYETRKLYLESTYKASLAYAKEEGEDTTIVEKTYTDAKLAIDKKYNEDKVKLAKDTKDKLTKIGNDELTGSLVDIFNSVDKLKESFKNISDPDFWNKFGENVLENMKILVNSVTSGLSSAFSTFQQIETDNMEAKYDAEIEAAKGNSEEVERLEQEKAQKKLDIEKKYADTQFAIKASEIIANTALGIMMAYGQLGPIAGSIFAALISATGAIQLAAANAERNKVKNQTLSGSTSSSSSGSRVATGRESGGYVDVEREQDGKKFNAKYDPDKRGYVDRPTVIVGEGPNGQSKEWVASNAAVSNPTIAPILDMIDRSQRAGTIRTLDLNAAMKARMAGYASGGHITPSGSSSTTPTIVNSGMSGEQAKSLTDAINNLVSNGIPASVVLTDLERKQQLRDRARKIGSKK